MSHLVCGDLHGRIEIAKELLQEKEKGIVFVGDYLDSFNRSKKDQIELLDLVLDATKNRKDVWALMGNHELSYLDKDKRCSGYNQIMQDMVAPYKSMMRNCLNLFVDLEDFLITHAGVSSTWLSKFVDLKTEKTLNEICTILNEMPIDNFTQIGRHRGGIHSVGGPLWCDHYMEFKPLKGIKQIFGHTEFREHDVFGGHIYQDYGDNWCIDCLNWEKEVAEISNGKLEILKL